MASTETSARRMLPVLPSTPAAESAAKGAPAAARRGDVRIGVVTLGCDKNTVDSERILGRLAGAGAQVSVGSEGADVIVVNTCGFIDVAKEESIETILEALRLKGEGRTRAVVAMGCLVQRYKSELEVELPEVDLFLGLTEVDRLLPELEARGLLPEPEAAVPTMERPLRVLSTSTHHTSFLKISEGCDHGCAFCAIPLMRGKHRSTPMEQLVREARELEGRGVVELNLISQDTTWYGRDWRGGNGAAPGELFVGRAFDGMAGPAPAAIAAAAMAAGQSPLPDARRGALPLLLRTLLAETSIPWFRLFYMYPSGISRELVELLAAGEGRLLPYLDMPIQHGSDGVLQRMRRPERQATIRERVGWLRDAIPELVLRTTVIVGFPGESDEEFDEMLELLEEIRFDRLGAFAYSQEEGTPAAALPGQVPEEVKHERIERLLDLQRSISLEKHEALVGRTVTVLVDEVEGDEAVGRTAGQGLEIDGITVIRAAGGARAGEFVPVRIAEAYEDELVGERIDAE